MSKLSELGKIILPVMAGLFVAHCSDAPEPDVRMVPVGVIAPDSKWEPIAEGLVYTDGIAAEADGDVYFADIYFNRLHKVSAAGQVSLLEESTQATMGLVIGPDGLLYACRNHAAQIVRYSEAGVIEVLLQGELSPVPDEENNPGEFCNDLAINPEGGVWFTDRVNERVRYLAPDGTVRDVAQGFRPNGLVISLDRKKLFVTDSNVPVLHAYAVGADGALAELPDFFDPVRLPPVEPDGSRLGKGKPGTNGMTVDTEGRLYVSSFYGIQIFDRDGKYLGVLDWPQGLYFLSSIGFGGTDYQWLYATGRNGVYRMKTLARGVGG